MVAKGFTQQKGEDFGGVFSLATHLESLRLLLSVMANRKWKARKIDIKSTFLNGDLHEQLYMEQPEGFVDPAHLDHV